MRLPGKYETSRKHICYKWYIAYRTVEKDCMYRPVPSHREQLYVPSHPVPSWKYICTVPCRRENSLALYRLVPCQENTFPLHCTVPVPSIISSPTVTSRPVQPILCIFLPSHPVFIFGSRRTCQNMPPHPVSNGTNNVKPWMQQSIAS